MAEIIKLKRGATAGVAPTGLTYGEPAVNVTDRILYIGGTTGETIALNVGGGATGATGATGSDGTNGATGATGAVGATGATGTNGTNGTNGATGATGTNGTNGTNGATGATGAIPSDYVISIDGVTGAITNVARTNQGNTFSVRQVMNAGITTANLYVTSGATFASTATFSASSSAIQLTSATSQISALNSAGFLSIFATGSGFGIPGVPAITLQDADTDIGGNPNISIVPASLANGTITLGSVYTTTTINGTVAGATFTGRQTFTGGITAANLQVTSGATFNSRASFSGGLTASNIFASSGVTFNSTSAHTGLATFSGGLTASNIYISGGATFASNISAPNIVNSVNGITGAVGLTAGSNITITQSGLTFTISSTGSGGATGATGAVGATGATGATGTNGTNGATGATGAIPTNYVISIDGVTGAVTNINAATVTTTSTNSASTFYPTFSTGAGNTALYVDNVTTPLSYVPSTGTLTVKSTSMTTAAINTTITPGTITLTDGTDVASVTNGGFNHNGSSNFSLASNVGVLLGGNFSVGDYAQSSYQYNFPTSSGSSGQVLTTDGAYPATLSWSNRTNTTTQTIDFSANVNKLAFTITGLTSSNHAYQMTKLAGRTATIQNAAGTVTVRGLVQSAYSYWDGGKTYSASTTGGAINVLARSADIIMTPPFLLTSGATGWTAEDALSLSLVVFNDTGNTYTRLLGSGIPGDGAMAGILFTGATFALGGLTLWHQEESYALKTVTGLTWVTADSFITCKVLGNTTADHDAEDAILEGVRFEINNIVAGVGFDIIGHAPEGTYGKYKIKCIGQ